MAGGTWGDAISADLDRLRWPQTWPGGGQEFISGCGFQLFLPYILLYQDGQDLVIMHTKMNGGMPAYVTPSLCYPS